MKHWISSSILVLCGLLNQTSSAQGQDTIRIATEEYPPYTSQNLNHFGIDAHIVSEAFKTQRIAVEYHFFPGARSYKLARIGTYDATLPWAKRAGREADFYYSDPVIDVDNEHLFFRKEMALVWDPQIPDYRVLQGKRIGAIISYNYGTLFQEAESDGVDFLRAENRGLKVLMDSGKYEQYIADFEEGLY